jgi:hypothetical protein
MGNKSLIINRLKIFALREGKLNKKPGNITLQVYAQGLITNANRLVGEPISSRGLGVRAKFIGDGGILIEELFTDVSYSFACCFPGDSRRLRGRGNGYDGLASGRSGDTAG